MHHCCTQAAAAVMVEEEKWEEIARAIASSSLEEAGDEGVSFAQGVVERVIGTVLGKKDSPTDEEVRMMGKGLAATLRTVIQNTFADLGRVTEHAVTLCLQQPPPGRHTLEECLVAFETGGDGPIYRVFYSFSAGEALVRLAKRQNELLQASRDARATMTELEASFAALPAKLVPFAEANDIAAVDDENFIAALDEAGLLCSRFLGASSALSSLPVAVLESFFGFIMPVLQAVLKGLSAFFADAFASINNDETLLLAASKWRWGVTPIYLLARFLTEEGNANNKGATYVFAELAKKGCTLPQTLAVDSRRLDHFLNLVLISE